MSNTQALPVIIEQVPGWEEEYDDPQWQLRCPHCGGLNAFREVEVAIIWNVTEEFEVVDGRIKRVVWTETNGSGDAEHDRYECEHCDKPVTMEIDEVDYQR